MVTTRRSTAAAAAGTTTTAEKRPIDNEKENVVESVVAKSSKKAAAKSPTKKQKTEDNFQVGTKATKKVTLVNQEGKDVTFESLYKDHGVIFFMYPRANTPGCTNQACGFRDHFQEIKDAGYAVYGLSGDSPKALTNWKDKKEFQYDLLSDPKHELIKYFGSSVGGTKVQRSHVIIFKGGIVADIQGKVSPSESVERAVEFVKTHAADGSSDKDQEADKEDAKDEGKDK